MSLHTKLLDWFSRECRPLPWRRRYRPYEVWVSEIMLQQTQVSTMLPYFGGWMKAFPTLEALAKAPEAKVLKAWQGLGYYSRARNLHATAKLVAAEHDGELPRDHAALLKLKGVGPYTAGAIASIAYNDDRPLVDGNVMRVFSRLFGMKDPVDGNRAAFWEKAEEVLPRGRARDWNQAVMELGALVCAPREPLCGECPVSEHCTARREGNPEDYPVRAKKKTLVRVTAAAAVIEKNGKFYLRRRPEGTVMGGLWEFPEWKLAKGESLGPAEVSRLTRNESRKSLKLNLKTLEPLGIIRRNYTHHLEALHVFRAGSSGTPKDAWPSAWASKKDFARYPFSSAHSKIADLL